MGVKVIIVSLAEKAWAGAAVDAIAASTVVGVYDISGLDLAYPPALHVERDDFGSRLAKLAGELGAKRLD
jgi:NADH/NAD ratio-sensing transcriptional regulator Rex